jgi:cyanophycin synthetase
MEQLARVKQVVIESVDPEGFAVLNADDPLVAEMAAATKGQVVYFARSVDNPIIQAHLAQGGRCVFVENDALITAKGSIRQALVELNRITFTAGGAIRFQLENALAATAAAWASGLNPALIVRALTTFRTDTKMVPGRFNILGVGGRQVILDYAHNLAAMKAQSEALPRSPDRKTYMVIGLPGDRRDEDLLATAQATLPMVDEYVLHDLKDRRGRAELEVPQLMKSCLPPDRPHQFTRDQREGVLSAFQKSQPGDRIIIIADLVDEALEAIQAMAESDEAGCETPVTQAYE